jgi:3',5'-cyclic AMP phosphodiesterase CpdA
MPRAMPLAVSALILAVLSSGAIRAADPRPSPIPPAVPDVPLPDPPVVAAAGDIADCKGDDYRTGVLLDGVFPPGAPPEQGVVVALGDNAYNTGSIQDYRRCYRPTWGLHRDRTYPVPGNHEYDTPGAAGYYEYFGARAGPAGLGYYSYDLGAWHVVALNSNCVVVHDGCVHGSPQERWLRQDLAAHPARCTLAYWHHPRFSTGRTHGDNPGMREIWMTLMEFGVDVVLSGHEHDYERSAPRDQDGRLGNPRGIRQFVVGTGGHGLYPFGPTLPAVEVRDNTSYGVLELTLRPESYGWQFLPATGAFTDLGEASCH